jgi:alcohol dehydrogenase
MEEMGTPFSVRIPLTHVGTGSAAQIASLAKEFGPRKILLVTDLGVIRAGLLEGLKSSLEKGNIPFEILDGCKPDAPLGVIAELSNWAKGTGCDLFVGVGGGSVMDTTKALSVLVPAQENPRDLLGNSLSQRLGLPKILVPTTAGTGSEWSGAAVVTDETDGQKKVIRGKYAWADAVIIDPLLTLQLPSRLTAETGMDALCHAIEAYVTWKANIVSDMFAEKAIRLLGGNLRPAYAKGSKHPEARYRLSLGASLAMAAAMSSALGLVHAMNYPLAMKGHMSHGTAITILLPHVMEYNLPGSPRKYARIAELLGEETHGLSEMEAARKSVEAVRNLARDLGMPRRMSDEGVLQEDLPKFVDYLFTFMPYGIEINPRDLSREQAARIFEAAW